MNAIGLMSGTSLDGIDAALVGILPRGEGYALELRRFETFGFDADLLRALRAALPPNDGSVAVVAALHHALGRAFAGAAHAIAGSARVGYVASHGQTAWHDGSRQVTLQLGDPFAIRESVRATVCFDFRSADCAAGGHGAPLVPHVDALLFASSQEDRVALNLGGIANLSLLPKSGGSEIVAFDTGPGNMLLDAFVRERTSGARTIDRDGALAAAGTVDSELLAAMFADGYFAQAPPKTTGRERFGVQFLARHSERLSQLRLEDGLATLAELTAVSVAAAVDAAGFAAARVIVSGGGARNRHLISRIAARLSPARVETSDAMGIPAEAKEAVAFAVLGYETLRGRASNVPRATGAARAVPLGAIAPYELQRLLADVERECRSS
ncbi:MAG: anhydro-N-acetylmuramic acid kinase [Candidatus Tumulicola sp.]